jgi:hypothetical protein
MAFGSEVMPNIALQRTCRSVTPLNAALYQQSELFIFNDMKVEFQYSFDEWLESENGFGKK